MDMQPKGHDRHRSVPAPFSAMMTELDHSLSERTDSRVAQFLAVPRGWELRKGVPTEIRGIVLEAEYPVVRRFANEAIGTEESRKLVASDG